MTKIVIEIPDMVHEAAVLHGTLPIGKDDLCKIIANGTPLPKGHWIDANKIITAQLYDDQHEEYKEEPMTIAEYLDRYTDEGCPAAIIEAEKVMYYPQVDGITPTVIKADGGD